jgi:hypothetical protein
MRRISALGLVAILLLASSATLPSSAEQGGGPLEVGEYRQFGASHDLTQQHISWNGEQLKIEGPLFTSELKVNIAYLADELGAWASRQAFVPDGDYAKFSDRSASFISFELGPEPVFTWGHPSQVHLLARPMWVSAQQEEHGANITLEFSDGDTTGQAIFISKEWLWKRGIHRPDATHQDGTVLQVTSTESKDGFLIEVHHFSFIILHPAQISVLGKSGSDPIEPHPGQKRWYPQDLRLEIDVGGTTAGSYSLYVEKDWLDLHIPWLALRDYTWMPTSHNQIDYLVTNLTPMQTPTIAVYEPFEPSSTPKFTRGSPSSFLLYAVNDHFFNNSVPMRVKLEQGNPVELQIERAGRYSVRIATDWLAAKGITEPHFRVNNLPIGYRPTWDENWWIIGLQNGGNIQLLDGDRETWQKWEAWAESGLIVYSGNLTSVSLSFPAYVPMLQRPNAKARVYFDICDTWGGFCGVDGLELSWDGDPPPPGWVNPNDGYIDIPGDLPDVPNPPPPGFTLELDVTGGGFDPVDFLTGKLGLNVFGDSCPSGCPITLPDPGVPDLPEFPDLPELPPELWDLLPVPPLPSLMLRESSATAFYPVGGNPPVVIDAVSFADLIPGPSGELVFTLDLLVEPHAVNRNTIQLKIVDQQGATVGTHTKAVYSNPGFVTFSSLPASLDLIYMIESEEDFDVIHPLQEMIPDWPVSNHPCHQTVMSLGWEPGHYDSAQDQSINSSKRLLAGGGHTYFFRYNNNCLEQAKSFVSKWSYGMRGENLLQKDDLYVWEFGAKIDGFKDYTYNQPEPFHAFAHAKIREPVVSYQAPTHPPMQFVFVGVEGRGQDEPLRDPQKCYHNYVKTVLELLAHHPKLLFLAIPAALMPEKLCVAIWDQAEDWHGIPGKKVWVKEQPVVHSEWITGFMNFRYLDVTPFGQDVDVRIVGDISHDAGARYCYGCTKATDSGTYYREATTKVRVIQPDH